MTATDRFARGAAGLAVVAALLSAPPAAPADEPAPTAVVTIDIAARAKPYSRMLFGGFIEHFHDQVYGGIFEPGSPLSDENGFRRDVVTALRELRMPVVRWPGGCFVSGYHWQDGVGRTRKPVADPVWGASEPNTFGTDEFVAWCRLVGCEPYICTNAGNGTPEEMRDWVQYCNAATGRFADLRVANGHAEPYRVRYWSIGNENYGPWEIGRKSAAEWGPLVARCAGLMREVDPNIVIAAAGTKKEDWSLPLLAAAGDALDYLAVHEYWLGYWSKNATPPYRECIRPSAGPERTIQTMLGILDEAGCRGRVKIAFDEWNLRGWHHPGFPRKQPLAADDLAGAEFVAKRDLNRLPEQYTMADALFTASFLNACLRHCEDVGMANVAPIVNTRGPLYVHPGGVVKRSTFHVLAMYATLLESHVAETTVEASPYGGGKQPLAVVDAIATVDASGEKCVLAVVNRHPDASVSCVVRCGDVALDGGRTGTILAGDSAEAFNDVEHPHRVTPVNVEPSLNRGVLTLPPHSLTMVRIR